MSNDRYRRGGREEGRGNRRSGRGSDDPRDPEQVERDVKQRLEGEEVFVPVGPGGAGRSGGGTGDPPGGNRHTLEYGGDARHPDNHASQPEAAEQYSQQGTAGQYSQQETGGQYSQQGQQNSQQGQQTESRPWPSPQQSHQGTPPKQPHQQPDPGVQLPYSEKLEEARQMTERRPDSGRSGTDTRSSWQERSKLGTEGGQPETERAGPQDRQSRGRQSQGQQSQGRQSQGKQSPNSDRPARNEDRRSRDDDRHSRYLHGRR